MKKAQDPTLSHRRLFFLLAGILIVYHLFVSFEFHLIYRSGDPTATLTTRRSFGLEVTSDAALARPRQRPHEDPFPFGAPQSSQNPDADFPLVVSGLVSADADNGTVSVWSLRNSANLAWEVGRRYWGEALSGTAEGSAAEAEPERRTDDVESCPESISVNGRQWMEGGRMVVLPCGLTLGSQVTVVGMPRAAWASRRSRISTSSLSSGAGAGEVLVSQFAIELRGLKTVEGEDPPKILHFNPRLKGDWSGKPIIEQNTCYRMHWGSAQRCEGLRSNNDEETVDGQVKCENWIKDDDKHIEESNTKWWLSRLIGRTKKMSLDWPYPFSEGKLFVLTLSAGLEGYHVNVDGKHVTSFPYHTGFSLEDATGLSIDGDVDIHSVFVSSLPTSHPSFAPQRHLEMSNKWKAPPLSDEPVDLFIGILSAGNHFAERMAVRKSWMQSKLIKSSKVVPRFFVALSGRQEINVELIKESKFFGDIVIVPYIDSYDLVVLKTLAICEHGLRTIPAKHIFKCDDDTFVNVDSVMNEVKKIPSDRSFYVGNINYYHKPLRSGKWAVTYKEWPEEVYPPYANGPGYIVSADIAQFVVEEFEKHTLRLFKMEDVSMGMWVEQFNSSRPVEYVHDLKYCQYGCREDYFTAHYQSPSKMTCLWDKLRRDIRPRCCDLR